MDAASDLRRALVSLNASLVANAVRALSNLNCLDGPFLSSVIFLTYEELWGLFYESDQNFGLG